MHYCLTANTALRSWKGLPFAVFLKNEDRVIPVSKQIFQFLIHCDGNTDIAKDEIPFVALPFKLFEECHQGSSINPWQKPRLYSNYYFPHTEWAITGKCNYNCRHCFYASGTSACTDEFSLEKAVSLLDEFTACGIRSITFTGGEPLLHPHIISIIKAATERGLQIHAIVTNASKITAAFLNTLHELKQNPEFRVSFDGIGHHDWMRRAPGAEQTALHSIRLLREYGFRVVAQVNIHKGNIQVLAATVRLLSQLDVSGIRIIRTSESPRWMMENPGMELSIDEYYNECLKFFKQYLEEGYLIPLSMWHFASYTPSRQSLCHLMVACTEEEYRDELPLCGHMRKTVYINSDGSLFPCNPISGAMRANSEMFGNIYKTPLKELLTQSPYLDCVFQTMGDLKKTNTRCASCPFFKCCAGGCRAVAYVLEGNYLGSDFYACSYYYGEYMKKARDILYNYLGKMTC